MDEHEIDQTWLFTWEVSEDEYSPKYHSVLPPGGSGIPLADVLEVCTPCLLFLESVCCFDFEVWKMFLKSATGVCVCGICLGCLCFEVWKIILKSATGVFVF